jgi:flagellin-like hook-associated protein FlgL
MLTDLERALRGESGQVYNGNEKLPTSTIGYADEEGGDYTPVLMDGGDPPAQILDNNNDPVPLTHDDEPINLQPVIQEDGSPMTIKEYSEKYSISVSAIDGTDISTSTEPIYLHAGTSINSDGTLEPSDGMPAYNSSGEPVFEYTDSGGNSATFPLLNSDDTPIQLREVPELGDEMLDALEDGANQVRSKRGLMGNNAARLESSISHLEGVRVDLEQILSRYEDVDILDVITEITQTETAFEGALKVTGQVSKLSILDYM